MQERAVTVAGHHYKLDLPYFVLATQIELSRRTYPLPEAQLGPFYVCRKIRLPKFSKESKCVKQQLLI